MSDIKLFRLTSATVIEVPSQSATVEKSLQTLVEQHLSVFLGVRLLASEYATGKVHGGRIDTLGLDEDGSPVIVEYKRATNETVINQGLFYLDWLMDHRAAFELRVLKHLGQEAADAIDWSAPRLLCLAGDFTKYDEHAVQQIGRDISLIRYKRFGDDLLVLELVNATMTTRAGHVGVSDGAVPPSEGPINTRGNADLVDRFEALKSFLLALGDDVQMKTLKHYVAFKRFRNLACVEVHPKGKITVFVRLDPHSVTLQPGFTRDVSRIGHSGTGDLEIVLNSPADFEDAKPLLTKSYELS